MGEGGGFGSERGVFESGERSRAEESSALESTEKVEREITMDVMKDFNETMRLLAWWIEVAPGLDPDVKQAHPNTNRYQELIKHLQLTNNDGGIDFNKVNNMVDSIQNRLLNPIKPKNYPEQKKFLGVFEEMGKFYYKDGEEGLKGRMGKTLGDYLYGLGIIMSDQVVYSDMFPDDVDPIKLRGSEIENGRHRIATLDVLEECGYNTATMMKWVKVIDVTKKGN